MGRLDIKVFEPLRSDNTFAVGVVAAALEEAIGNLMIPDDLGIIAEHVWASLAREIHLKTTDPA